MATLPNRYLEDLTGTSPNNKVVGDIYSLRIKDVRAVATRYGPFFGESIVVYDDVNNIPLVKNKDYSLVGLLPELTERTGKGIYDAILIVKKNMGDRVRLEYQVIGGHYHNQATTIAQLTEALLNDNRKVDWLTGINGKPSTYNPSLHSHWLQDVVGFGPLVAALDRIANSITIGQAPIFNFLLSRMQGGSPATEQEVAEGIVTDKYLTPATLKYALDRHNFNAMYLTPYVKSHKPGAELEFRLSTNLFQAFDKMYWTIDLMNSEESYFESTVGSFKMVNGEGSFKVKLTKPIKSPETKTYQINIRRDAADSPVMVKSYVITIVGTGKSNGLTLQNMMNSYSSCCIYDGDSKDPLAMFFSDKTSDTE